MNIYINGRTYYINQDQLEKGSVLDLLIEQDLSIPHPCMGGGKCGKCKIKTHHSTDQPLTTDEDYHLSDEEKAENYRLACCIQPSTGMSIVLLDTTPSDQQILNSGYLPVIQVCPNVKMRTFYFDSSDIMQFSSWAKALKEKLPNLEYNLSALASFNPDRRQHTAVCIGEEVVEFNYHQNANQVIFGLAIDIGTTTIVLTLVDLSSGNIIKTMSDLNPQTEYGLDVLSRITYVMTNEAKGLKKLQDLLLSKINQVIKTMCKDLKIDSHNIYEATIAANPTMTHLLLGISPKTLGRAPFIPMIIEPQSLIAKNLGLYEMNHEARIRTLPLVSAYVGSDIVAGTLISQYKSKKTFLLIDIGTNGELVLQHDGKLSSCSCAAGPAMEGMNISSGMRASTGAIEDIHITKHGINLNVIGNSEPIGLCGSGVLAVMREALANGLINKRGRIVTPDDITHPNLKKLIGVNEDGKRWINLTKNIKFTQSDVRQIQLAKGSILAAIYTLLEARDVCVDQVDKIFVAGQFGAHVKESSLLGIGIVPKEFSGKIEYIGNASHSGAYLSLINTELRQEMVNMAQCLEYIELSLSDVYERKFAKCTQFIV